MLIDEHLDVSKCASVQNTTLLKIVQDKVCGSIAHALMDAHHVKAIAKFPDLENYARCWPVTDLVMMRLKYTYIEPCEKAGDGDGCRQGQETCMEYFTCNLLPALHFLQK